MKTTVRCPVHDTPLRRTTRLGTAESSEADELLAYPAPEPWHAFHRTCDPDPDGISYWIAVERIRTWQDVVRWTSHLAEKCWYTCTDWEWVIEGLAHHGELRFRSVDLAEASR